MEKHSKIKSYAPKGKKMVKKEKQTKEPKIVRGFFDDEPYEYAKGGMSEHGLKMNDTIKSGGGIGKTTIRVHNSNSGDARVDLDKGKRTPIEYNKNTKKYEDKMAKGGKTDEKPTPPKGKRAVKPKEPQIVRGFFDDEPYEYGDGGAIYVGDKVKIKGSNKTMVVKDISKGKKGYVEFSGDGGTFLKGDIEKYAEGGEVGSDKYKVVKVFRKSGRKVVLEKYLTREEAIRVVNRYPNSNTSMVIFTKMFEQGGMTSGWCYSIGGL